MDADKRLMKMTILRSTILAAAAVLALGSSAALASPDSLVPANPAGNANVDLTYRASTAGNGASTGGFTGGSYAAQAPRADTCFVDQPVYNKAGKMIGHHTVDICAQ